MFFPTSGGGSGGNMQTNYGDEEFDTWTEERPEIGQGRKEAGNRHRVAASTAGTGLGAGGSSHGGKSREEINAEKKKRIIDRVMIKILAEIKRRESAKKSATAGEVTPDSHPNLFDTETGAKLTFGTSTPNPGRYCYYVLA